MDLFKLTKQFWDFCEQHTDVIKPNHIALYFHILNISNKLGWLPTFGLPSDRAMEMLGMCNYKTYIKTFNDLESFGLIEVKQRCKNINTSTRVALVIFTNERTKVTTKASANASPMQQPSDVSIDKPLKTLKTFKPLKTILNNVECADAPPPLENDLEENQQTETPKPKTAEEKEKEKKDCAEKKEKAKLEKTKVVARISFEQTGCTFSVTFKKVWLEICGMPKWKSKPQTAINKSLQQIMEYPEEYAIQLCNNAIAGDYKGLVYPDTKQKYDQSLIQKKNPTQSINPNAGFVRNQKPSGAVSHKN